MTLDPATLGLAFVLLLGVLGGLLLVFWSLQRTTHALAWWGGSFGLGALGIACVALGQTSPSWPLLLLGNGSVAAAYALQYTGCRVFNGRSPSLPGAIAGPLTWLLAWPLIAGSFEARLLVMTAIVSAYNVLSSWEFTARAPERLRFQRFAAYLFAGSAAFHTLRGLLVLGDMPVVWISALANRWSAELALMLMLYGPTLAFVLVCMTMEQAEAREHRTALEAQESEARYRLLAENATDMIVLTGADGVRRYISPASRDVLGYEPDELMHRPVAEFMHPDDALASRPGIDALFHGDVAHQTLTYRFRHKQGHWVWLETRRRLLRDEHGRATQMLSVVRDISERVQLEEQLRQSQKMEAVGQLTGGVAHDFNNLLTVVIGNNEILAEDLADKEHRELATMALEAAERGAYLTQQLLAFGRRQSLRPERLRLEDVVDEMVPLLRRTIGAHIELVTERNGNTLRALADRPLLESAILNLVLNARDAMADGGTLTIETGEDTAGPKDAGLPIGQPVVFVTVSDTGPGMSPEVLERVFEPFFTTKEVGKGSGLGLSIVYGFAQQSGGHVAIESEPGRGTRVTILLRAVSGEASADAPARGMPAANAASRHRVLVVEDEPPVLQFVTAQLTMLGYDVTAVSTGPDALSLLNGRERFDLLFTDVVLPKGMNGIELSRRAKQVRPDLKVLLTSGYPTEAFEDQGSPQEGTPLLRKPYRRKELAETLSAVLGA